MEILLDQPVNRIFQQSASAHADHKNKQRRMIRQYIRKQQRSDQSTCPIDGNERSV